MRKRYDTKTKAKIALEAIRGENTLQELSAKYEVHQNLITKWKKELQDNAEVLFEKKGKEKEAEAELEAKIDGLYQQIGKLQVEKDFLKKKYKELYGTEPIL